MKYLIGIKFAFKLILKRMVNGDSIIIKEEFLKLNAVKRLSVQCSKK